MMNRVQTWKLSLLILGLSSGMAFGATPATPSYIQIDQRIQQIRSAWETQEAEQQPNSESWIQFFDALQAELRDHAEAADNQARLRSLERLYRYWMALGGTYWVPALEVRSALEHWLRPRIALSWAEIRLAEAVQGMAPAGTPEAQANRDQWLSFRDNLRDALREYESASTALERRVALRKIHGGLDSLRDIMVHRPWGPALTLQASLDELFDRPNLSATASADALSPFLNQDVVQPDVVYFRGQTSYVTPGPKTGYGLLHSDQGIAFYNSQFSHSVTPIRGFQQEVAQDPQGRQAANLYHFSATGYNTAHINATALLTSNGLFLYPATSSNITASIGSAPIPGHGRHVVRTVAGVAGFDQGRITNEVRQEAIPQIQQEAASGTQELAQIKSAQQQAEINAQLGQFLRGNQTLAIGNIALTELSLASRPQYALVGGLIRWLGAEMQGGADFPKPPTFNTWQSGVTADIHLPSVLTNMAAGFLQSPMAQGIENLMIEVQPGNAEEPFRVSQNVDYATFLQAVRASRESGDPEALAARITKPGTAPEFSADANGNLVAILNDITIEVPAPPGGVLGQPAEVIRVVLPTATLAISFRAEANGSGSVSASGEVIDFQAGAGTQVFTLGETDEEPRAVNVIARAGVIGILNARLRNLTFDETIPQSEIPGVIVQQVSELDPSGWLRVVVYPTGENGGLNLGGGSFAAAPAPSIPAANTGFIGD
ncbi:hypothetical protein BH23PLA1_BH23PLA1_38320 [soil metagenome]